MNRLPTLGLLCVFLLIGGCASFNQEAQEFALTVAQFDEIQQLEDEFLSDSKALDRLEEIQLYNQEASFLWNSRRMRIGPLGNALVEAYPASLSGHLLLSKFYANLNEPIATHHDLWVDKAIKYVEFGRDGSINRPFRALTIGDAYAYVRHKGRQVIGSSYGQHDDKPLIAYTISTDESGITHSSYFEIRSYPRLKELLPESTKVSPIDVILALAQSQDNAAQAAYGKHLLETSHTNQKQRQQTIGVGRQWLQAAARSRNALAHAYLANFAITNRSDGISWNVVQTLLERAIQLGLTEAKVTLARLNLAGVFGDGKRELAVTQLKEAAEKQSVDAASILGSVLSEHHPNDAIGYFKQAAELGTNTHKLQYVKNLLHPHFNQNLDEVAFGWVENLAEEENADAMLLLARIHAKGEYDDRVRLRKALRWYRKCVALAPDQGETVNEVAWVFATSNIQRLRKPSLAIEYMDNLMASNPEARQFPAYIDTWAAAYASKGDFQTAIELQKEALSLAENSEEDGIADILRLHLKEFEAKKALIEEVP